MTTATITADDVPAEPAIASGTVHADARRPVNRVIAISTTLLVATAAVVAVLEAPFAAARPGEPWMVVLVAVGFALAERFVFHVEYRREALTFTLSEMPAALALIFLSPVTAILVRTIASAVVIRSTCKSPAFKLFFNSTLFSFSMAFAYLVARAFTDPTTDDVRFFLWVIVALALSNFIGPLLISVAISCFEGDAVGRFAQAARTSIVLTPAAAVIAAAGAAPTLVRVELFAIAIVPVVLAWTVVVRYGRLVQSHRDLVAVHGFSALVQSSLHIDEVARVAARESKRLTRAETAVLQVYAADGSIAVDETDGAPIDLLPTGRDDVRWAAVFDTGDAVAFRRGHDGNIELLPPGRNDRVAVPVSDSDGVIGLLVLADRAGASGSFDVADLARMTTIADQLASSLRNALLHAQMEHTALHDTLTGDLNRHAFERELGDRTSSGSVEYQAVLMMDLNRFKEVNDTLGHHMGDRVLTEFANRVRQQLDDGDMLSRFGGDEFAILVTRPDAAAVVDLAERIVIDSQLPLSLDELDVVVTTSIGIAPFETVTGEAAEVLRQADIAMYHAKSEHTEIEFYCGEIDRRTPERLSLLTALRRALDNGDLEVHYQPKVDLYSSTVTGAEALVRWNHPSRGWIAPSDFIQVAEDSGLIKQVTDQILRTAIETACSWQQAGYDLCVAVNLSAHDLLDAQLPSRIKRMLDEFEMPADHLTLEITESALLADTPRTMSTIDRLDRLGVRLSLDDFGTGYSSLGYLRRLPVSELKVDQSFVKNVLLDVQDEVIVKSTIDLGHNLGLQVVAEGIENMPVLTRALELGADIAQGYGISRPLPPELFRTWLSTTDYRVPRAALDAWV
ncbi:MAG: EAL domain-containing protein [Ilumatobacter sp.]|nr:EAL domain-containing protein [Ilumatobacter sp.]